MKMIQKVIVAILALVLTSTYSAFAVTGVQLSIQGADVVLRWPSQPCRTYIIGHRPDFDPATPWTYLTTTLSGAVGSETTFTHSGAFQGGQQMAAAIGGGSPQSQAVALSAAERTARRAAARESARKSLAYLTAQLEAATASASAMKEERLTLHRAGIRPAMPAAAPESEVAAAQVAPGSMGFYFVADYSEDSDNDGLPNCIELEVGLNLLKADSDGNGIADGDEDWDSDGVSNFDEVLSGTLINEADGAWPPPLLPFGTVFFIEENFTISCTPGTVQVSAAGSTSSSQDLLFLDAAADMAHGITAVETLPGVLNVKLHSIYIGPEFGAFSLLAANSAVNPFPRPSDEQLHLLQQANGEIDIGFAHVGEVRQGIYDQLSENTLDWARWRAEYGLRQSERVFQEINSGQRLATAAEVLQLRANIVTQAKRLTAATSSLARRFGRAIGRYLPLIGGIMIFANGSAIAGQWNTAFQDYANDITNGDDTTGSAAILAGLSNDLAPGAGNFVLNYLLR